MKVFSVFFRVLYFLRDDNLNRNLPRIPPRGMIVCLKLCWIFTVNKTTDCRRAAGVCRCVAALDLVGSACFVPSDVQCAPSPYSAFDKVIYMGGVTHICQVSQNVGDCLLFNLFCIQGHVSADFNPKIQNTYISQIPTEYYVSQNNFKGENFAGVQISCDKIEKNLFPHLYFDQLFFRFSSSASQFQNILSDFFWPKKFIRHFRHKRSRHFWIKTKYARIQNFRLNFIMLKIFPPEGYYVWLISWFFLGASAHRMHETTQNPSLDHDNSSTIILLVMCRALCVRVFPLYWTEKWFLINPHPRE